MVHNILALGRDDPFEKIDYLSKSYERINPMTDASVEHSILNEELILVDGILEDTKATMRNFLSAVCIISRILNRDSFNKPI